MSVEGQPAASAPVRAVVADDDGDVRALLEIAVRRAGIEVAGSHAEGHGALADVLASAPDVVVLDHAMPGLTGIEVTRAIRAAGSAPRPLVVIVSATVDGLREAATEAGADDCVAKPFAVRELAELLRLGVEARRMRLGFGC